MKVVFLFTCLTNNASKLSQRIMIGYAVIIAFDFKIKTSRFKKILLSLFLNLDVKRSNFSFIRLGVLVPYLW